MIPVMSSAPSSGTAPDERSALCEASPYTGQEKPGHTLMLRGEPESVIESQCLALRSLYHA